MTIETKHPARRVLAAIAADIWAILPESLEQIFEIASRLGDPEALAVKAGQRLESSPRVEVRDGVAILPVRGPIVRYADMFSAVSGATALSTLARDFQAALVDPAVSAIVLEMDSPGGQATGIHGKSDDHVFRPAVEPPRCGYAWHPNLYGGRAL